MDLHLLCNRCLIGGGEFGNIDSSVQCLQCNEVLVSRTRHDFVGCKCANKTFVDGGYDYTRCGGMHMDKIKVLKAYSGGKRID
jgi:ribosomal protein L37AE/L43A